MSVRAVDRLAPPEPQQRVKPRLRGRLHQWAFVVSLPAGLVLLVLAPGGRARLAAAVYAASASLLFGISALYHRRTWQPRARGWMRRLDHSMILVLIAGTYTPLTMLLLPRSTGQWMLKVAWLGAATGIAVRMLWLRAPRWAVLAPYLLVGCVALLAVPELLRFGGVAVLVLLLTGGAAYVVGAVIYAARRPDPQPAVFGYHELFHLLTVLAGIAFYIVNSFAVYRS